MVSRISVLGEGKAAKMLARRATGKAGLEEQTVHVQNAL